MLKRLGTLDRVLVLTLVPFWLMCLALELRVGTRATPVFVPVSVSSAEGADHYPTVKLASESILLPGDRLIRVGGVELLGKTAVGFYGSVFEVVDDQLRVAIEIERSGNRRTIEIDLVPDPRWWGSIPSAIAFVIAAVMLLARVPEWQLSRWTFVYLMLNAIQMTRFWWGGQLSAYASGVIQLVSLPLTVALAVELASRFPDVRPRHSYRFLSVIFGIGGVIFVLTEFWISYPWSGWVNQVAGRVSLLAVGITVLWALTQNYLRADRQTRRQMKWIVFGVYIAAFPHLLHLLDWFVFVSDPWMLIIVVIGDLAGVAVPMGVLVAVLGYRFLDINPLISSTTSYSFLVVSVIGGTLVLVPRVAVATGNAVGLDPSSAQLILSMALAAVAIPIHRSLRPRIDRLFFPERHAVDEGINDLLGRISREPDPRGLTTLVGEQVDAQFRPDSCVVYSVAGQGYEPVFARGKAVPPAVESGSPLITTLQPRTTPLAADRFSRKDRIEQLSLFERATLDTLGVAVVVPIRRRGDLAAFLCLGPKRSGDIYTSTDLALLTAVANAVSSQLDRFEDAQILQEARSMQQELRRFVPGAIAKELEAGADLEPRERPVTVLFVDIRDYTSYSERHKAQEVFTTINRYTHAVSSVVEKFGGSVVEFNGDGMMAVFGAPTPLPEKERAAVSAGREIITKVHELGGTDEPERISVGVGVATGSAFVGSIQAVDRMIWTALGNTTNLAARLQGLTRDLDSAMVIDLATQRAAGDVASEFERREQVTIRGRAEREDVYLLG